MTSQQQADEWLTVWRELRALGYSPEARDAVIRAAITDCHVARVEAAIKSASRANLPCT